MMVRKGPDSRGQCNLCGGVFTKLAVTTHLKSCRQKQDAPKKASSFHLLVQGKYAPEYWMHIEVLVKTTLETLDQLLRDMWLECCGHMSQFQIAGTFYSVHPLEPGGRTMCVELSDVLSPGMTFLHEYDFGSTTHLTLKVVSEGQSDLTGKKVRVLARNEPPEIPCSGCGKPAKHVCAQCIYEGEGWVCDDCAAAHECGDEMLLPVVNSPRVGMCGYTG